MKLVKLFPTETLDTYFLAAHPPKRRFASGKVVNRYHNAKAAESVNKPKRKRTRKTQDNACDSESEPEPESLPAAQSEYYNFHGQGYDFKSIIDI